MQRQKITIYPSKIEDINANKEILEIPNLGNPKCMKRGCCVHPRDKRYYHSWMNLKELKTGGLAQCGYPATHNCNYNVYYDIKGYRNTCPIGGCNGTFHTPALLKLSNFDFKEKGIQKGATIHSITVNFEHRCNGVDVGNGRQHYNWGPDFSSINISTPRIYCAKGKDVLTHEFIGNNPPVSKKFKGTGAILIGDKLTSDNLLSDDFGIYIRYGPNLSTNPGILFLKGLQIIIEFTNIKPALMGTDDKQSVYVNNSKHCSSVLKQTVFGGFINFDGTISPNTPQNGLGKYIKVDEKTLPNGVTKIGETLVNESYKEFSFKDNSEIVGEKRINYYLENYPEVTTSVPFDGKIFRKPKIKIEKQYLKDDKNLELYKEKEEYITAYDGCCDYLYIYFDSVKNTPDLKLNVIGDSIDNNNILIDNNKTDFTNMKKWYNAVAQQDCGTHTAWIQRCYIGKNDEEIQEDISQAITVNYEVIGQQIKFKIFDENNPDLKYSQNKNPDEQYQEISIQRIDNQPLTNAIVTIFDETNPQKTIVVNESGETISFKKQEIKKIKINKYYSGKYHIRVEVQNQQGCKLTPTEELVTITPNHIQYHDKITIRGEDSTSFDYEYLVAWEGDNIHTPINIKSTEIGRTFDDIHLCSEDAQTGLSEMGIAILKVSNTTTDELKNIRIELNTLKEEDNETIQTTDEWVTRSGVFYNFYNNFNSVNNDIIDIVDVENLTPDNDLTGEENVYLHIKKIPPKQQLHIKIPFVSTTEKQVFLQYLIFEEPQTIYHLDCQTPRLNDYITLSVYDSILTSLDITGDNDLLFMDKDSCPQKCYKHKDGEKNPNKPFDNPYAPLTYTIMNIDSSNFDDGELAPFVIKNSIEMNAYRILDKNKKVIYEKDDSGNEIFSSDRIKVERGRSIQKKSLENQLITAYINYPQLDEEIIKGRTDKNGEITFYINLPDTLGENYYTIEELFDNFIHIEYAGNLIYNSAVIQGNITPIDTILKYTDFVYQEQKYDYAQNNNITIKSGDTFKIVGIFGYEDKDTIKYIYNRPLYLYRKIDGTWRKIQTLTTTAYTDESYNFEITIKNTSKSDKKISDIMKNISLASKQDTLYNPSVINYSGEEVTDDKKQTVLKYIDTWESYKAGTVAIIKVKLEGYEETITNEILFNALITKPGDTDSITVYYKMCNLKNYNCNIKKDNFDFINNCLENKGIFSTILQTNSYTLIPNQITLPVYCGIESNFDIIAKIQSKVIEQNYINVLYVNVNNKIKYNKDVTIDINLGQVLNNNMSYLGDYTFLSIENDDGDYVINQELQENGNENIIVTWKIGDMEPYTSSKAIIKIKADDIGLSDIKIIGYDYLHTKDSTEEIIEVGKSPCPKDCG